jgi:hypothetical protein
MNAFMQLADNLENDIRSFLKDYDEFIDCEFILPNCNERELVIPLMIVTFEREGWDVDYDEDEETKEEWLIFKKKIMGVLESVPLASQTTQRTESSTLSTSTLVTNIE